MQCPLCQTELPDDATQCTRCDWVRDPDIPPARSEDWIAAALSIVPGLGHIYKGHLVPGILLLLILGPLYLAVVFLLIPETYGLSLILPAFFVIAVGMHAFHQKDARQNPGVRVQALRTLAKWSERLTGKRGPKGKFAA